VATGATAGGLTDTGAGVFATTTLGSGVTDVSRAKGAASGFTSTDVTTGDTDTGRLTRGAAEVATGVLSLVTTGVEGTDAVTVATGADDMSAGAIACCTAGTATDTDDATVLPIRLFASPDWAKVAVATLAETAAGGLTDTGAGVFAATILGSGVTDVSRAKGAASGLTSTDAADSATTGATGDTNTGRLAREAAEVATGMLSLVTAGFEGTDAVTVATGADDMSAGAIIACCTAGTAADTVDAAVMPIRLFASPDWAKVAVATLAGTAAGGLTDTGAGVFATTTLGSGVTDVSRAKGAASSFTSTDVADSATTGATGDTDTGRLTREAAEVATGVLSLVTTGVEGTDVVTVATGADDMSAGAIACCTAAGTGVGRTEV
jgi:hypothetical protein